MASCSTWTLALPLLHLCVSFHLLSSFPIEAMEEFEVSVKAFGDKVKDCPEDCAADRITNGTCQCFNFSVSPQECGFPDYFIKGLNSMSPNTSSQFVVLSELMIGIGESTNTAFNLCSSDGNSVTLMSPKSFHRDLESVMQQLNSRNSRRR